MVINSDEEERGKSSLSKSKVSGAAAESIFAARNGSFSKIDKEGDFQKSEQGQYRKIARCLPKRKFAGPVSSDEITGDESGVGEEEDAGGGRRSFGRQCRGWIGSC